MVDDDFAVHEKADKPIGVSPNPIIKKALENLYVSIVGALDVGDFETFLKESADLTYDETKDKMLREYGSPKQLSEAGLRAKSEDAKAKIEQAEREALAEQKTFEDEFTELDEIARQRLGEVLDLTRRNDALESEVIRLKEELEKTKAAPGIPPSISLPVPPPVPSIPPAHGSMYNEYKKLITPFLSAKEGDDLVSEIFEIAEREEFDKLTKEDITELLRELGEMRAKASMKELEKKIAPERGIKKQKPKEKPQEREEEIMRGVGPEFFGVLPSRVMYRYGRPDPETAVFQDIPFFRDHELERTIIRNNLLLFPPQWYMLPSEEKINRYGWTIKTAFQHAVEHLHKYSWDDLTRDYGIPKEYVAEWRKPE